MLEGNRGGEGGCSTFSANAFIVRPPKKNTHDEFQEWGGLSIFGELAKAL